MGKGDAQMLECNRALHLDAEAADAELAEVQAMDAERQEVLLSALCCWSPDQLPCLCVAVDGAREWLRGLQSNSRRSSRHGSCIARRH